MKKVELWNDKNKLGVKFPLDLDDQVCQAWAWTFKEYGYEAYYEGCTPGKHKPVKIPQEILDYPSPAKGVIDQIDRAKSFFADSSEFFQRKILEDKRKKQKICEPKAVRKDSALAAILKELENGKADFSESLEKTIAKFGYTVTKKLDKYYLNEEIIYG